MRNLKSYISIFMLALLLLPMAEKVTHELGHLDDIHCGISKIHFCEQEHHCSTCDYLSTSFSGVTHNKHELPHISSCTIKNNISDHFQNTISSLQYCISLRGPPLV